MMRWKMKVKTLRPKFVRYIPEFLKEGILYISIPYATASHLCPCGCASKVVTPISRMDWTLTWNGEAVTLDPSVGNWSQPCRTHYWVREGAVVEAGPQTRFEIHFGRIADLRAKRRAFSVPKDPDSVRNRSRPRRSEAGTNGPSERGSST